MINKFTKTNEMTRIKLQANFIHFYFCSCMYVQQFMTTFRTGQRTLQQGANRDTQTFCHTEMGYMKNRINENDAVSLLI